MAWNNTFLIICAIGLVAVIAFVIWRLRAKIKSEVPGSDKLSAKETYLAWKADKDLEKNVKSSIGQQAKQDALKAAEQALYDQAYQAEYDRITGITKPNPIGGVLGDKLGNPEKVREMLGNTNSNNMFDPSKLDRMVGKQPDLNRGAKQGGSLNYDAGVRKSLNSKTKVDVESMLYRR